jgi:hypothetical protein
MSKDYNVKRGFSYVKFTIYLIFMRNYKVYK